MVYSIKYFSFQLRVVCWYNPEIVLRPLYGWLNVDLGEVKVMGGRGHGTVVLHSGPGVQTRLSESGTGT